MLIGKIALDPEKIASISSFCLWFCVLCRLWYFIFFDFSRLVHFADSRFGYVTFAKRCCFFSSIDLRNEYITEVKCHWHTARNWKRETQLKLNTVWMMNHFMQQDWTNLRWWPHRTSKEPYTVLCQFSLSGLSFVRRYIFELCREKRSRRSE